ncbi:MAG: hypothetical protein LQ351_003055 [Letrouitia transgressa]|nr:MAG: hypothetical protein LQ351_003055 [Letrouitia transgressa]
MAIKLSVAAIWGIGAAGVAVVVFAIAAFIVFFLRRRHRALVSRSSSKLTTRRAHMSITDEDVARMPGMKRLRSSTRLPYKQQAGWNPISSRENVTKKTLIPNPADIDPVTHVPPWPTRVPRGLKKPTSTPLVRMPAAALSPITERSTIATATSPNSSAAVSAEDGKRQSTKGEVVGGLYKPKGAPDVDISPTAALKPKPLFHGQQRSFSHGMLSKTADETIKKAAPANRASQEARADGLQVIKMPRSTSLGSQPGSQPPSFPVPPLPMHLPTKRTSQTVSAAAETSPRRISGYSLLSGDTSVLDQTLSNAFSQAETDFTSVCLTSPSSAPLGLGIFNSSSATRNFSRPDRFACPSSGPKAKDLRPQLNSQKSFRASIHSNPAEDVNSRLSTSLLEQSSRDISSMSTYDKQAMKGSAAGTTCYPGLSPLSLPRRTNVFQVNNERKSKLASASVLQAVSGNQRSPFKNPWNDRPNSIATEDPFRWDPKTSMQPGKPSAMKGGARRHKRQSCVRIFETPIIIPSESAHNAKEDAPPVSDLSRLHPSPPATAELPGPFPSSSLLSTASSTHPPSFPSFSPLLSSPLDLSPRSPRSPYSPTLHILPHYRTRTPSIISFSTSTSPTPSTPTRNPSIDRQSHRHSGPAGANPNRRRPIIFANQTQPVWPLLSSRITPEDPPSSLQPALALAQQPVSKAEDISRPTSWRFSFQFPDPPSFTLPPPQLQVPSRPSTSPRGPRGQPTSAMSGGKAFASRRTSVVAKAKARERERERARANGLRKSVQELRRMNSDVSYTGEGFGHQRYLSLGKDRVAGPRQMPETQLGTPRSLYDGKGFLRE